MSMSLLNWRVSMAALKEQSFDTYSDMPFQTKFKRPFSADSCLSSSAVSISITNGSKVSALIKVP